MIPKLIHQTNKTDDVAPKWRGYQQKLRELHPDWTYRLWTDADNDAFVRAEYPDFYQTFCSYPRNIMRADVIRYLLMDRLGGLYMDLDYEMLRPFDLVQHPAVLMVENDVPADGPDMRLANSIFASTRGHPFFRRVIESLKQASPLTESADVEDSTGPHFITRVFKRVRDDADMHVHLAPKEQFNPETPRSPRQYRAVVSRPEVYGIHHCNGSWRNYSLPRRIRNNIVTVIKHFT